MYFPWAWRLCRQIVVANGGIGVVVGEQAAEDLQSFLEQRLEPATNFRWG